MKCKNHPKYRGVSKPKRDCKTCWKLYEAQHPEGDTYKNWIHKCKKHPKYQGKTQPKRECKDCWAYWNFVSPNAISFKRYKQLKKKGNTKRIKSRNKRKYKKLCKTIKRDFIKRGEFFNDYYIDYNPTDDPYEISLACIIANYFLYGNTTYEQVSEFVDFVAKKNIKSIGAAWLKILSRKDKEKYKIAKEEYKSEPASFSSFVLDDYKEHIKIRYGDDQGV